MPKLKTKSSVKKRFKLTASGKIKVGHANKRHNLRKRSTKMKRTSRGTRVLSSAETRRVLKWMPWG